MSLTVRLDAKTERALTALAKRRRQSRSDIVREALKEKLANADERSEARSVYDAWADVIGSASLGRRDPNLTTGEIFTQIVREKARARRSR